MIASIQAKHHLEQRHRKELVEKRGLLQDWISVNCRSLTSSEASELLGYKAQSDGIWLEGTNDQGQFKPEKPWKSGDEKGKAPKYRSGLGEYDAMLPIHPVISNYWDDLEELKIRCYIIDGVPCILLTEGFFKAIAGCSNDIPTIALLGVEMGLTPSSADPQGKRYLVPTLERLAKAGFGFIIGFDADCATNKNVVEAQRKLAHQLKKFNSPVYSVTGLWDVDNTFDNKNKGMDDYIQNHGANKFRAEVLNRAQLIEQWEKQFKKDSPSSEKPLPPRRAAKELVERYRNEWKYDLERQTWRHWDKVWVAVQDEVFTQVVYRDLDAMPNVDYATFSYVENVEKFLKTELLEKKWLTFNRMEWIAFNDCVLEVKTGLTHEHAPGFGFTSRLEHNYPKLVAIDPTSELLDQLRVNTPTFYSWAMYSQKGDPLKVLKLLAICNGTLKFRFFDLQMFVLLQGVPGAGKGTFARLLESMVGQQNYSSAKLHKLGEDNVIAAIIDKQLVVCPDEKKHASDFSGLLSLTGGDSIPYRPIYKPLANGRFYGTIVILANSNPFVGDTTGIDRRMCLATFDVALPARDTAVEQKMQAEVGALMALALLMPDKQVTDLITGTGSGAIPDFKRQQWLHKTENDSVALFMEECLVAGTDNDFIMLGGKGDDPSTLYGAYVKMCEENNSKTLFTRNNFRGHLLELCREIGWHSVREARQGNGWRLYGIRLRQSLDPIPRISDWLGGNVEECNPCRPSVEPILDLKPLLDLESVGYVDQIPPLSHEENEKNQASLELNTSIDDLPPTKIYTPTQSSQGEGFKPVHETTQDLQDDTNDTKNVDLSSNENTGITNQQSSLAQAQIDWSLYIGKTIRFKKSASWHKGILLSAEYLPSAQFKAVVKSGEHETCIWYEGNLRICE